LNGVANFNVFPIENYNRYALSFDPKSMALNKRFRRYSYQTSNFVLNSGFLFYSLILYVILAIIYSTISHIIGNENQLGEKIKKIKD